MAKLRLPSEGRFDPLRGLVDWDGQAVPTLGVLLERNPDTVRETDVFYISAETLPPDVEVTGYYDVVLDLVAEIRSPGDSLAEFNEKIAMWLREGANQSQGRIYISEMMRSGQRCQVKLSRPHVEVSPPAPRYSSNAHFTLALV